MYRSIQVKDFDFSSYPSINYQDVRDYKAKNEDKLINIQKYLLNEDNILSVDKIANHLFLDVKADIFLSHSPLYTTNFTEPLSYQDSAFLKLPKFP